MKFNVTYEIVTEESARDCDVEERGYISKGVPLRDALDDVTSTRTRYVDAVLGVEAHEGGVSDSIVVYNGMEFVTGAYETRTLHLPKNTTKSTLTRILHLITGR